MKLPEADRPYIIINTIGLDDLIAEVNEQINRGYTPSGSVLHCGGFIQAMYLDPAKSLPRARPQKKNMESLKKGFSAWWDVYPNKTAKKKAFQIWCRIEPNAELLIKDTQTRAKCHKPWVDGFVPNATTYLNQERWTDDLQRCGVSQQEPQWEKFTPSQQLVQEMRQKYGDQLVDNMPMVDFYSEEQYRRYVNTQSRVQW